MKINNPFRKIYTKEHLEIFAFYRQVKLFENLQNKELEEFLPVMHLRTYRKNEAIFFRNDPSQALYVIKSGSVELNFDLKNSFETLAISQKYIALGINALLTDTERAYNAITHSDEATVYVIPQVNILEIFRHNALIKAKMMTSLAEIYNKNTENMFKSYRIHVGLFSMGEAYMQTFGSTENLQK